MADQAVAAGRRAAAYRGQSAAERAAARRERIVLAALRLFSAKPYADVTVADVCTDAKVAKRHFYEHFANREDLLLTLHRQRHEWLLAQVAAAAPARPADLGALLRPMMATLVRLLAEHPQAARVVYVNAPRTQLPRRGELRAEAEVFGRLIRRAVPAPADLLGYERALLALVAGVTEVVTDWLEKGAPGDPDALADHLARLGMSVMSGLR